MKLKRIVSMLLVLFTIACLTGCGAAAKDVISVLDDVTDILLEETETSEKETQPVSSSANSPIGTEEPLEIKQEESITTDVSEDIITPKQENKADVSLPDANGWYYDLDSVVLYLDAYGILPSNYITKSDAEALGWSGGSVQKYKEGAAIGGSRFGNYEGLLPKAPGRNWTECDIDTDGTSSRGAKRLVFSNDGLYYYTDDHYESFQEVICENGEVILK